MENVIIIRYCEIHLKGKNRGYFEGVFLNNIKSALKEFDVKIAKLNARLLVESFESSLTEQICDKIVKVFGVHTISVAEKIKADLDQITASCFRLCGKSGTFKVESSRGDKRFPLNSMQLNAELGARILTEYPQLSVDVHNPDNVIRVDVRENQTALVFCEYIKGPGGMPVGTSGKGVLLLSGGIDSPVAGYMMAKRGMKLEFLHFHSYPYTSAQAREKVLKLAEVLADYNCGARVRVVSVTHIQEEIHKKCNEEYMITLLRRFMMRIAERLGLQNGCQAIITGESLGQVASQTIEGMTSSGSVVRSLPILRPLVGFDKLEIIERAEKIGTYDISILPYEDCCTVFLPQFPLIKPNLVRVEEQESKLDVDLLLDEAFASIETVEINR